MKILTVITLVFAASVSLAAGDFLGYKLDGKVVKNQSQVSNFIQELNKLRVDEEYEIEVDLCVVYGDEESEKLGGQLDQLLNKAGLSLVLEGIYGDVGNHVFEVYDVNDGNYLGAISGIYDCE